MAWAEGYVNMSIRRELLFKLDQKNFNEKLSGLGHCRLCAASDNRYGHGPKPYQIQSTEIKLLCASFSWLKPFVVLTSFSSLNRSILVDSSSP